MTDFFVFGYARDKENYRKKSKTFEPKYSITNEPRNSFYIPLISLHDAEKAIEKRDIEIMLLKKQIDGFASESATVQEDSITQGQPVPRLKVGDK